VALWTKLGQRGVILLKLARRGQLEELRGGLLCANPLSVLYKCNC
jgi:hypothetical protein